MSQPATSEPRRRHLLFDVMGTLVYDPFFREVPRFFDMSLEELLRQKCPSAWIEFESGERSEQDFLDGFFLDRRPFDHDDFRALMRRSYRWLDGMQRIVRELRARRPIHLVSNYPVWYRTVDERTGLSEVATWTFVSCEAGVRKPDAQAYRVVTEAIDGRPEDCLFVDDSEANCEAARALGMDVIRFRGPESLRDELTRRGLLR